MFQVAANRWGGPVYGGPMGVVWTAITHSLREAGELAFLCIGCGACDEVCPVEIPLSGLLRRLKAAAASRLVGDT